MLEINQHISIADEELKFSAIRAQGAGGQNVNKVSSAIHLRFDIKSSSLEEGVKYRLLALKDRRISREGILVIKAQRFRTQEKNRVDALERLREIVLSVATAPRSRRATRPSKSARKRRTDSKVKRGKTKALRGKVHD